MTDAGRFAKTYATAIETAGKPANAMDAMNQFNYRDLPLPDYSNLDGSTLLRRKDAAPALKSRGYPVEAKTLATMATRGGGPPFRRFGRVPLYLWSDLLTWANGRLSPAVCSTSELDAHPSA